MYEANLGESLVSNYEVALRALRSEIKEKGARPSEIDRHLDGLIADSPSVVFAGDLLALLSDDVDYDEGMFSLIHAAEATDDTTYVRALLFVFPSLLETSPRWGLIVLMRVLNSAPTQLELVRQLRDAAEQKKSAVRLACERLNNTSPEFLAKTVPVTLATA